MTAPLAHLQRRLDSVPSQPVLQLQQVLQRILVVGIDRQPFTALRVGVDCIQPNRDLSLQVAPDRVFRQFQWRTGPLVVGTEIVMTSGFGMSPGGLQRVCPAVHK